MHVLQPRSSPSLWGDGFVRHPRRAFLARDLHPVCCAAAPQLQLLVNCLIHSGNADDWVRVRQLQVADGHPVGADLRYESAHSRRGRADTISKILFQYLARREPLTLQALLEASQAGLLQAGMQG